MFDLAEVRSRVDAILTEMESLDGAAGGHDLNGSLQTRWTELDSELEYRTQELRTLERSDRLRESREKYRTVQVSAGLSGRTAIPDDITRASGAHVRDAAMALMDDRSARHVDPSAKAGFSDLIEKRTNDVDGDKIARHALATSRPEYRSAFQKIATSSVPVFSPEEVRAIEEVRSMSLTAGNGGYAVPVLLDPTIILTGVYGSPNDILSLSRVETITTDKWTGVASAGVTWRWGAEVSEVTDNSSAITQPQITARKADGFVPFSVEVGADWPSFAADMSVMLTEGYRELLVEALTTGTNGSNQPDGLISSLDALTSPANLVVTTAGTLGTADLYDMFDALPVRFRHQAATSWISSTDVQNTIRQLGTSDPNFSVDITAGSVPSFFGQKYVVNDYMQDMPSGTGNQPLLAVGDLKAGYLVAQRAGMTVEYVPHLFATANNRPSGQRGFYAFARVGAGVVNPQAFRLLVNKPS